MFTTEEVSQYARLTLKEFNLFDVKIEWINSERFLGLAYAKERKIELSTLCLSSFRCFRETLIHEILHIVDYDMRGGYVVNKYEMAHGKNWRKLCKKAGIPARKRIPA